MTETRSLYGPVADDIAAVGSRLRGLISVEHPLLTEALSHVFDTVGKQLRPALCLLAGKLGRYELGPLVTLATAIEVVHTATLVHDDTIDGALTRRGLRTVNAVWDRKVAILLGDYLFAQSAELAAQLDRLAVMSLLSETVMAMSSGELRQYASSQARLVDETDYFDRIRGKTASLFAMCCEGAGIVSDQSDERVAALRTYGLHLGLAFQIADDVLDFLGDEATLGKPAGGDLFEGTVTLPLILYARDMPPDSAFWEHLRSGSHLEAILEAVQASNAPARALERAEELAAQARAALEIFESSPARDTLLDLTEFVTSRTR